MDYLTPSLFIKYLPFIFITMKQTYIIISSILVGVGSLLFTPLLLIQEIFSKHN